MKTVNVLKKHTGTEQLLDFKNFFEKHSKEEVA